MDKFTLENELRASGFPLVCGVDEVGRGPLAGPVVCAAVIMPAHEVIDGIDDSKKLSAKKREKLSTLIRLSAMAFSIFCVQPQKIDEVNILQATRLCMKGAVESLSVRPDFVITDGNMTLDIDTPQRPVIGGDASCYSIGAASVLAKVYRDALMDKYAELYPAYGFARNKGYGTAEHIAAIKEYGLCPIHRRSFTRKWA
ncbi:MAG TPA: ribonuclease HII [Candidatus Coproplasma avistercoris]|nr:ribonuclease HII [Candidatus Coproplasma avistercoris]